MILLLTYLAETALSAHQTAYNQALAARDGFAFALTCMRGINARESRLSDFQLADRAAGSVQAYLTAQQMAGIRHPGSLHIQPHRTKTSLSNPHRIRLQPATTPVLDVWF